MKKFVKSFQVVIVLFMLTSCVSYYGPRDYVGFYSEDEMKTSNQFTLDLGETEVSPTYEEEFIYDDEGILLKEKTTEYFDRTTSDPKFIVWETEYVVIGGHRVPSKAYVNGELYSSVTYDVLTTSAEGAIEKDVSGAFFYRTVKVPFQEEMTTKWSISLKKFPVPFNKDDKFVSSESIFSRYYGYEYNNVLNIGYDNIVVKEFFYSYDKVVEGVAKSLPYGSFRSRNVANLSNGNNITFNYTWASIADKACPEEIEFISQNNDKVNAHMVVKMQYDESGFRTNEEWIVIDEENEDNSEITVFKQELTY